YGAEISPSAEGRLLGHVALGLRLIAAHVPASLGDARRLALEHCVMLHHGPEGGQRFASPEALALCRLNALDAHIKGAFDRVVAERFGLDYVDLSVFDVDLGAVNLISAGAARRYRAVAVGFGDDDTLLLAMADPTNVLTIDDVAMLTGRRVRPVAASSEDLDVLLARVAALD